LRSIPLTRGGRRDRGSRLPPRSRFRDLNTAGRCGSSSAPPRLRPGCRVRAFVRGDGPGRRSTPLRHPGIAQQCFGGGSRLLRLRAPQGADRARRSERGPTGDGARGSNEDDDRPPNPLHCRAVVEPAPAGAPRGGGRGARVAPISAVGGASPSVLPDSEPNGVPEPHAVLVSTARTGFPRLSNMARPL